MSQQRFTPMVYEMIISLMVYQMLPKKKYQLGEHLPTNFAFPMQVSFGTTLIFGKIILNHLDYTVIILVLLLILPTILV